VRDSEPAHGADDDLRLGQLGRRVLHDRPRALGGVRPPPAGHDRALREQPARGDDAPHPVLEPERALDDEVRDIVRERRIEAVVGAALEAHHHAVRPPRERVVRRAGLAVERHLHRAPP